MDDGGATRHQCSLKTWPSDGGLMRGCISCNLLALDNSIRSSSARRYCHSVGPMVAEPVHRCPRMTTSCCTCALCFVACPTFRDQSYILASVYHPQPTSEGSSSLVYRYGRFEVWSTRSRRVLENPGTGLMIPCRVIVYRLCWPISSPQGCP
jgi:hypothetical protein